MHGESCAKMRNFKDMLYLIEFKKKKKKKKKKKGFMCNQSKPMEG